jgi:hypothetical protein
VVSYEEKGRNYLSLTASYQTKLIEISEAFPVDNVMG